MADVGGAALGAVFGELLSTVLKMKDKATLFKPTLVDLRSTLEAIAPVIKEIEQQNNDLGRPKEELEKLIKEMEEATKLVSKCSKIHRFNYLARVRYQEQLVALLTSLVSFFTVEMQAQTARDQKETLLKVRRILSKVNKLPFASTEDTTDFDSDTVLVDASELEIHDSTATQFAERASGISSSEQVIEHISQVTSGSSSDSDHVPEDVSESETFYSTVTQLVENSAGLSRTNSAEQSIEDITSLTLTQESEAKANNNQLMEHLMSEKSYGQLCTSEKRIFGISLPKIGGFNRQVKKANLESPPVYWAGCLTGIKQNDTLYTEGADMSSYSYCSPCYNERVPRKIRAFESCPYKFDLEDLLSASVEMIGNGSYGTTAKAILRDGTTLLVKRLKQVAVGKEKFEQQVKTAQRLSQHPNVMPILAYYYSKGDKLLIYDYITPGSFSRLLHGTGQSGGTPLDWDSRLKISLGAAKGIAHIHSAGGRKSVHGNITASNVLVTLDLQGCVSDFGLASLASLCVNPSPNEGYLAPEVINTGNLTHESDVYSFGVLLLEVLTGKSPVEYCGLPSLVQFDVADHGLVHAVLDDELRKYGNRKEMIEMVRLAMACAASVPDSRPSMDEVVWRIEEIRASN